MGGLEGLKVRLHMEREKHIEGENNTGVIARYIWKLGRLVIHWV